MTAETVVSYTCMYCEFNVEDEGDHRYDCPIATNWWPVFLPSTLCEFCDEEMKVGEQFRLIPSLPEDDPNYDVEKIGSSYARFNKVSCRRCATIRLAPQEKKS